ncbi:MAG: Crp/Fnr family transcriptional regulator [Anaerolineae bacterium]|nr:Crp/Fnr family transcriptional regulator [Anaerolineae bacterium]
MTTKDLISFTDIPLFANLAPDVLGHLYYSCHTRKLETREILFHEGDHGNNMYIISSGRIRIWVNTSSGHEVDLAVLGPNEVLGELEIFDGKPRSASAQALEYTLLVALPREAIFDAIGRNPAMAVHMITILSGRLRNNNLMRIQERSETTLMQKLARLLLIMGESLPDRFIPLFNYSQAMQLLEADAVLTRDMLNKLETDGAIAMNDGSITLLDTAKLHHIAG